MGMIGSSPLCSESRLSEAADEKRHRNAAGNSAQESAPNKTSRRVISMAKLFEIDHERCFEQSK
jgi:hypothetical protein